MFPPTTTPRLDPFAPGAGDIPGQAPSIVSSQSTFTDGQLLEMHKRWKKESFDQRWIFERQWMRNVWYMLNRQWSLLRLEEGSVAGQAAGEVHPASSDEHHQRRRPVDPRELRVDQLRGERAAARRRSEESDHREHRR